MRSDRLAYAGSLFYQPGHRRRRRRFCPSPLSALNLAVGALLWALFLWWLYERAA